MNLTGYVDELQQQLAVAAAAGGAEAQALAERLVAPLDASARLVLLDALSAAAGEITREMAPGSVDLRLRGQEPSFVVTLPPSAGAPAAEPEPSQPAAAEAPAAPVPDDGDAAMVRINLRLPEHLKSRVEDAAGQAGLSVNSWLVRAATAALGNGPGAQARTQAEAGNRRSTRDDWRTPHSGQRLTGWVR